MRDYMNQFVVTPTASEAVVQLIKARKASGSIPGSRTDGRKLALAIEGGGMRGVVSGGMVAALEELNLLPCFDAVYGSSAGAICGAYLVAQQARFGVTIFYENINNGHFLDLRRFFFSKNPTLSLSFLLDKVCIEQKPLDTDRVLQSPIPLRVISTSVKTLRPKVLRNFQDAEQLFKALKASATIPVVAGGPVDYSGDLYFDASVSESIPYRSAISDGFTDVVALLTRPKGAPREATWVDRYLIAPKLRMYNPRLPEFFLSRELSYAKELQEVASYANAPADSTPRLLVIQKSPSHPGVRSHEKDRQKLVFGAMSGFKSVYEALGLTTPEVLEIITPLEKVSPFDSSAT